MVSDCKDAALAYYDAGLCVLPKAQGRKTPACDWGAYQAERPSRDDVAGSLWNHGLTIVCGKVSGNLVVFDFDQAGAAFSDWLASVQAKSGDLATRLTVSQTPSGGYHVPVRCAAGAGASKVLARSIDGKKLIETRGEGGIVVACPSPGYAMLSGDWTSVCEVTADELAILEEAARDQNQYVAPAATIRPSQTVHPRTDCSEAEKLRRATAWLAKADPAVSGNRGHDTAFRVACAIVVGFDLGEDLGFELLASDWNPRCDPPWSDGELWHKVRSARKDCKDLPGHLLDRNSTDWAAEQSAVDLSRFGQTATPEADKPDPLEYWAGKTPGELHDDYPHQRPYVIDGIIREGEVLTLVAAPKVGKSWFAGQMGCAVAAGSQWFGRDTIPGLVMVVDRELTNETLAERMGKICRANHVDPEHAEICVVPTRGKTLDTKTIREGLEWREANGMPLPRLLIIDPLYRCIPAGIDENDNNAMGGVMLEFTSIAERFKCAVVVVHHTSKGNQQNKSSTDVGAGAGSITRAVDGHITIVPDGDSGTFRVSFSLRSSRSPEPLLVQFDNGDSPGFRVVGGEVVDTSRLGQTGISDELLIEIVCAAGRAVSADWVERELTSRGKRPKDREVAKRLGVCTEGNSPRLFRHKKNNQWMYSATPCDEGQSAGDSPNGEHPRGWSLADFVKLLTGNPATSKDVLTSVATKTIVAGLPKLTKTDAAVYMLEAEKLGFLRTVKVKGKELWVMHSAPCLP